MRIFPKLIKRSENERNHQISAEKPSLNVSRSLNFEEDSLIPEGVRMDDVNILKFQKSPFCQGLFGEEEVGSEFGGPQKWSKPKRIPQKRKIEYLRSSDNQTKAHSAETHSGSSLLMGTGLEDMRTLPKVGEKLEDLEFEKFMQKLLHSPFNPHQSKLPKSNEHEDHPSQSKQVGDHLLKEENFKGAENHQADFAKTLSYMLQGSIESDKVKFTYIFRQLAITE